MSARPYGSHWVWPSPWSGIGLPWYHDCREHLVGSSAGQSAAIDLAAADLIETLNVAPSTYWFALAAERELAEKFAITVYSARKLMQQCKGAVLIENRAIWCAHSAVPAWQQTKAAVYGALPTDKLVTFEELTAAAGISADNAYAAICVLVEQNAAACFWEDEGHEVKVFTNARADQDYDAILDAHRAAKAAAT